MASVNKVIVVGNVGRDPELRYMQNNDAVCTIAVATTDKWKDKTSGEQKEATEWHRVNIYGKLAEIAGQYLKKGSQVYIEGSLKTRKWTDKDGVERYTTEISANTMQMLGSPPAKNDSQQREQAPASGQQRGQQSQQQRPAQRPASKPASDFSDMDDDIPF